MADAAQPQTRRGTHKPDPVDSNVPLPWGRVGLLFLGSGAAALIYEIIWFHLLRLVIGGAAVSLAIVLGTFMGGMGLGSLLLPRLVPVRLHPLKVYATLELGIGLIGATLPHWFPWIGKLADCTLRRPRRTRRTSGHDRWSRQVASYPPRC